MKTLSARFYRPESGVVADLIAEMKVLGSQVFYVTKLVLKDPNSWGSRTRENV